MPRYNVILTYDVPFYATMTVDADSPEQARDTALRQGYLADFEASWDASSETRLSDDPIVEVDTDTPLTTDD